MARRGTRRDRPRTARAAASARRRRRARTPARRRTSPGGRRRRAARMQRRGGDHERDQRHRACTRIPTRSPRQRVRPLAGARHPVADREHARDREREPLPRSRRRPWVHDPTPCQTGRMAFHHVAITTKDLDATHRFYTEAMGFDLVKVEAAPVDRVGLGPAHLLRHRQRRDARGLGHPRRRGSTATAPRSPPGSACRRGRTTSRSTPPTSTTSSCGSSAGSTTASTACASITAGARRSTPTTRAASPWSSARRRASSPPTTAPRPHRCSPPRSRRSERPPEVEFFTANRVGATAWTSHRAPDRTS